MSQLPHKVYPRVRGAIDEWNADDTIDALLEQDEDFIDKDASPIGSDAAGKRRCARFAA